MSALGHKRKRCHARATSVLPIKADIRQREWHVRYAATADICGLCYLCSARIKMLYLIAKALRSGVIIMAASEAAKRSPTYGALLVYLPLMSILAMIGYGEILGTMSGSQLFRSEPSGLYCPHCRCSSSYLLC